MKLNGIIDCDVHPHPKSAEEIRKYIPLPWRNRLSMTNTRGVYLNPISCASTGFIHARRRLSLLRSKLYEEAAVG